MNISFSELLNTHTHTYLLVPYIFMCIFKWIYLCTWIYIYIHTHIHTYVTYICIHTYVICGYFGVLLAFVAFCRREILLQIVSVLWCELKSKKRKKATIITTIKILFQSNEIPVNQSSNYSFSWWKKCLNNNNNNNTRNERNSNSISNINNTKYSVMAALKIWNDLYQ